MSDEHVPKYGRYDVAFAGAQLKEAWLLIGSIFVALVAGSLFGWPAYIGIPFLGFALTKAYIQWKNNNLDGYLALLLYRWGLAGYSSALNRKRKLFLGDGKVVNPSALRMASIMREDAAHHAVHAVAGAANAVVDNRELLVDDTLTDALN